MKKITVSMFMLVAILIQSKGQLRVENDNNVGIGANGESLSSLYVENSLTTGSSRAAKFFKSASGTSGSPFSFATNTRIALNNGGSKLVAGYFYAYEANPVERYSYGIYSIAGNGSDGCNYGVWGRLAGSRNGAAIYGTVDPDYEYGLEDKFAGYFRGNVKMEDDLDVVGIFTNSDITLKKDISYLSNEEIPQSEKIKSLSAIKYKLKNPAELNDFDQVVLDTMKVDPRTIDYPQDKYHRDFIGLSAQDVQKVYPELVKEDAKGYLSVNYIGLIPVLIDAIKEQQTAIELLKKELEELKIK